MSADEAWRHESPFVGTNSVFFGSNGGGNGWASKPQSLYGATNAATGGWSTAGHEARPSTHIASVPDMSDGTNFAFMGSDGYHYGWARQPTTKGGDAAVHTKGSRRVPEPASIRGTNEATGGCVGPYPSP